MPVTDRRSAGSHPWGRAERGVASCAGGPGAAALTRRLWLALVLLVCPLTFPGASAAQRVALVIGNGDYISVPHLRNPVNDAKGMAQKLRELGFAVALELNLDKARFERTMRDFAETLNGAQAAVFFYAGHGLQVDGRNYMVPVDAQVTNEADLPFQLVAVDIALQRLAGQRITNIVILDACRDNPLGDKLAGALGARKEAVGSGLASIFAGVGTLISFSTQPGNVALDGAGANSPFTEALLKHIATPNVDVLSMMKSVRRDVVAQTQSKQVPWDTSSLVGEFFFRKASAPKPVVVVPPQPGPKREERERPRQEARKEDLPPLRLKERTNADTDTKPHSGKQEPDSSHMRPPDDGPAVQPVMTGRPPVQACDRIAASATDPERVTPGRSFGAFDGPAGVAACRAALRKYPNTARFEFQLARSLQKSGAYGDAAALYRKLVDRGYFAALVNYGWLLNNGQGVARDQREAVRLYVRAAQQGDTLGMFNVAMAYDSGQGLPFNPAQAADWIYAALRLGHDYSIEQMSGTAEGWTREFRIALQRLLKRAGVYKGSLDGVFGPDVWRAVARVQTLPFAPTPGGAVPKKRFDPTSIPVNAPPPRRG